MLKTLLKKQLTEIFRSYFYDAKKNKKRSTGSTVMLIIMYIFIMVFFLGAIFTFLAVTLCGSFVSAGMGWLYFALFGLLAILLGAFGSVFNTYSGLYLSKDNDLLLSMPIPVRYIMISRLLGVYLMGLMYSGVVIVPAVVVYWIAGNFSVASVVGGVVFTAVISLIVLVLSCALGWVVARISLKLKNKSFVTVIVSLLFVGAYYFLYYKAQEWIADLVSNAAEYGEKIRQAAYPVYAFGRAGEGGWLELALLTVIVAALFALTCYIISRSFIKIATSTGNTSKVRYRSAPVHTKSQFGALLGKEFRRFTSSPNYILNCGLGTLILLLAGVYFIFRGGQMVSLFNEIFEMSGIYPVIVVAVIGFAAAANDMAAPSVSLEGKSLWLVQSLPVDPWLALKAKLSVQIILTLIPAVCCVICAAFVFPFSPVQLLLVAAVTVLIVLFIALFDLVIGVRMPNLTWTNEIVPIKQGMPVFLALMGVWLVVIVFAGVYLLLAKFMSAEIYLAVSGAVFVLTEVLLYRWLKRRGAKIFAAL